MIWWELDDLEEGEDMDPSLDDPILEDLSGGGDD